MPVLTPKLSALRIHLVTPVPAAIAQPLTEGLSLPGLELSGPPRRFTPKIS